MSQFVFTASNNRICTCKSGAKTYEESNNDTNKQQQS